MIVTAGMIAACLERAGLRNVEIVGSAECVIEHVRPFADTPHIPKSLYLVPSGTSCKKPRKEQPYALAIVHTPTKGDHDATTHCEAADGERDLTKSGRASATTEDGYESYRARRGLTESGHASAATESGCESELEDACDTVVCDCARLYDILRMLDRWDAQLKDFIIGERPIDEIAALGSSVISRPFALYDANLRVLMEAPEYPMNRQNSNCASSLSSSLEDLLLDDEYHHAANKTEPFYYYSANGRLYYCLNFHHNGIYTARLVTLIHDASRLDKGEEQLIAHFAEYVDRALAYSQGFGSLKNKRMALKQLVSTLCEQPTAVTEEMFKAYFEPCGWNKEDTLLAVMFVLEEKAPWNSATSYLSSQLEKTTPGTVALAKPQEITWVVNLSLLQRLNIPEHETAVYVHKVISDLCRDFACKAGESQTFNMTSELCVRCKEAHMALTLGEAIDPSLWHYRFADYALAHLLRYGTGSLEKRQLCHPSLLKLIEHDAQNDTEYALTLISYLRNNQSPTAAADSLFIHRTSLLRRLERIGKITALHLDDPDEVLHLLISAQLMDL